MEKGEKMKKKFMEGMQRFGGAMYTPVLLFTFPGLMIGISSILQNPDIVGSIANKGTLWSDLWFIIREGSQTVFRQMPIIFTLALPIGLAKKQRGRAAMEAIVVYLTFNYFVSAMLTVWGPFFGVDLETMTTGLTTIAGIKTFDTGIAGSLIISGIVVWLHNRYFEKALPDWLGVFKGSAFIYLLGFFIMIPTAFIFALIWPKIQIGLGGMQAFFMNSGVFGVFGFTTLARLLIPAGLHHFIYMPFNYGDAVVQGGLKAYWSLHMTEFAQYTGSLVDVFPEGRFLTLGYSKVFGSPGIAAAFYFTSKKENRKKVLALIIPIALTAIVAGITEPIEFTFLFISPMLFVIHSLLSGVMGAVMYMLGIVGGSAGNLIEFTLMNWIPLWGNHSAMFIKQIAIGLVFSVIWFVVFYYLIIKFNIKTPGREDSKIKFYSKTEYKNKNIEIDAKEEPVDNDKHGDLAAGILSLLGGSENIKDVTNCASRLRVNVHEGSIVQDASLFREIGAFGLVRNGNAVQIIVGLDVPIVRERFEELL